MGKLSSNQQAFIRTMKEGEEFERQGFSLLLKRPDFTEFFDDLAQEGLFDPARNPAPVEADSPGYVRIPPWQALPYLEATAKAAGERDDATLASKVMDVIRAVSNWRNAEGRPQDNYATWFTFATIIGLVPRRSVELGDLELIPIWLSGQFNRSMVAHSFASGSLANFIASDDPADWEKAAHILHYATALTVSTDQPEGKGKPEVRTVVEDYWVKELVNKNARVLGQKLGERAADVFVERLIAVFPPRENGLQSWLYRPAVETHQQNYSWRATENVFVDGLRDVLLAWAEDDPQGVHGYIDKLLATESEMAERIAIYLVNVLFSSMRDKVLQFLQVSFMDSGHLHELYNLLKVRFAEFTEGQKEATLQTIRDLPLPSWGEDPEKSRRYTQRQWLSAIVGQGDVEADRWFNELNVEAEFGKLSPHPDFMSYHESHWGPGPSKYSADELLAFARSRVIVAELNAYVPASSWNGHSSRALADCLTEAVAIAPELFAGLLPDFEAAKPIYQYAIIAGFKKSWDSWDGKQGTNHWDELWPKLIAFLENLLETPTFWEGQVGPDGEEVLSPTRDWIPPLVSELIRAGVQKDNKAFAPVLMERTLTLVDILLEKSGTIEKTSESSALDIAINAPKGKAIEALVDHALRASRLEEKKHKSHTATWKLYEPRFDRELATATGGHNFEFSALCGSFIANLEYLSADWLFANFSKLFPLNDPINCMSAMDGLAYAPSSRAVYSHLLDAGVIEWALGQTISGRHTRESLIQRVCLAYLWGDDELDSPRFQAMFVSDVGADLLEAARYFWSVQGEPLSPEQRERIVVFVEGCIEWGTTAPNKGSAVLSAISLLACYFDTIGDRELAILLAVAPHTPENYNVDRFIEELARLAPSHPDNAGKVLTALLQAHRPDFDFEDKLGKLIVELSQHDESRDAAILAVERVRYLPGMVQLYRKLVG